MPIIEGSDTTKVQALTDILEAIALEEAAIAHILNAEGEKLQRIAANEESSTQDLLHTNQAIDDLADTLTNLTLLVKSKTRLALKDKCYGNVCPPIEPNYTLNLTTADGSLTRIPNTPNEYDLYVDTFTIQAIGPAFVTVIFATNPPTAVTLSNLSASGVGAAASGNILTITPNPIYEGTVSALIHYGGNSQRIVIHVHESQITCDDYTFDFETSNGTLSTTEPYIFRPLDITSHSTLKVSTQPTSTVSLTDLVFTGNIMVNISPEDTLDISYLEGFSSATVSVTVAFGEGCTYDLTIAVELPCSDYAFEFVPVNGSITEDIPYIFTAEDTSLDSTLQVITTPNSSVSITNLQFSGNLQVTITPLDTFKISYGAGFTSAEISATLHYGNGCSSAIAITVLAPCDEYLLDFETENGSMTLFEPYTFTPADVTQTSTITINTIPESTVTLTELSSTNLTVAIIHDNILELTYPTGFYQGSLSATVNFANGCTREITIAVELDCSSITINPVSQIGTITETSDNQYDWIFPSMYEGLPSTGDSVTLNTEPSVEITGISIVSSYPLPQEYVITQDNMIYVFRISDSDFPTALSVNVSYATGCSTILNFNISINYV